ncbi:class I SAM-dependent methyltransferase [Halobaculum sp. MBLA0147]|uniref:class I SAM-dependent methyltransferase n=1 Tax=Halobaculum sp. MBLA0147 TaxID=3079934 RepID=UPI0035256C56
MVDPLSVAESYTALAETYAADRDGDGLERTVVESVVDGLPPESRVLDAGCGDGVPGLAAAVEHGTAYGVDISAGQLALASERVPSAGLARGDLRSLPITTDAVDCVVALHSLIHVPLEDHQTVIDEFARVLRPGGTLVCTEGHTEWVGENPDWLDTGVEMAWEIAGTETTIEQLESAGFSVEETWASEDELADEEGASKPIFRARLPE